MSQMGQSRRFSTRSPAVRLFPNSGVPSRKGCQFPNRKGANRGGDAVVLGVDGIADFNALHSVKSMRRLTPVWRDNQNESAVSP
jgi:hypothetical protein